MNAEGTEYRRRSPTGGTSNFHRNRSMMSSEDSSSSLHSVQEDQSEMQARAPKYREQMSDGQGYSRGNEGQIHHGGQWQYFQQRSNEDHPRMGEGWYNDRSQASKKTMNEQGGTLRGRGKRGSHRGSRGQGQRDYSPKEVADGESKESMKIHGGYSKWAWKK